MVGQTREDRTERIRQKLAVRTVQLKTRHLGQGSWDRTAGTEWPRQMDNLSMTAETGEGQDREEGTIAGIVGTGQSEQDSRDRTTSTGQLDRKAMAGQPGQDTETKTEHDSKDSTEVIEQLEQDSLDRTARQYSWDRTTWTEQSGQGSQDRTGKTRQYMTTRTVR